jgi:hypothetical protein
MSIAGDTTAAARRIQIDAFRRMGGPARLLAACRMSDDARDVTLAGIRYRHPNWTDEAVHRELLRLMLGAELAERVVSSSRAGR